MQIDKVIRIGIEPEFYYDEISEDTTEWWYNREDLQANDTVYAFIKEYYPQAIQLLEDKKADYLALYSDF